MEENKTVFEFNFDETSKKQLKGISQWAAINAVLGFIGLGLNITQFIMAVSSKYRSSGNGLFDFIQIALAILLNMTLYTAAMQVKNGIDGIDTGVLTRGLGSLRNYYKILGIVLIMVLVIALLAIVFISNYQR